jgi:hypothetical protein
MKIPAITWKWVSENSTLFASIVLLSHNLLWCFHKPTVFTTVTYCAAATLLAHLATRKCLMWAWLLLMLVVGSIHSAYI